MDTFLYLLGVAAVIAASAFAVISLWSMWMLWMWWKEITKPIPMPSWFNKEGK